VRILLLLLLLHTDLFSKRLNLNDFAKSFIELSTSHGCVPAFEFTFELHTVHKDIVNKLPQIQDTIKSGLQKSAEQGADSVMTDLWSDNVMSCSYLDLTFFWVEESGSDSRMWSLKRVQIFSSKPHSSCTGSSSR